MFQSIFSIEQSLEWSENSLSDCQQLFSNYFPLWVSQKKRKFLLRKRVTTTSEELFEKVLQNNRRTRKKVLERQILGTTLRHSGRFPVHSFQPLFWDGLNGWKKYFARLDWHFNQRNEVFAWLNPWGTSKRVIYIFTYQLLHGYLYFHFYFCIYLLIFKSFLDIA